MQIRFSYETKYGIFSDALNLPDDHELSEQEITTIQEQRRDNWIQYIDSSQNQTPTETSTETPSEPTETSTETPSEPTETSTETPSEPTLDTSSDNTSDTPPESIL